MHLDETNIMSFSSVVSDEVFKVCIIPKQFDSSFDL